MLYEQLPQTKSSNIWFYYCFEGKFRAISSIIYTTVCIRGHRLRWPHIIAVALRVWQMDVASGGAGRLRFLFNFEFCHTSNKRLKATQGISSKPVIKPGQSWGKLQLCVEIRPQGEWQKWHRPPNNCACPVAAERKKSLKNSPLTHTATYKLCFTPSSNRSCNNEIKATATKPQRASDKRERGPATQRDHKSNV